MAVRPSVPEIITVNSEALQTQIRDLLPSQNGFGSELQASNVITPIIDLTSAAEGSAVRSDLQTALAFGSCTAFSVSNATTTILNSPGFYRIVGVSSVEQSGGTRANFIVLNDGVSNKAVWSHTQPGSTTADSFSSVAFDVVVFLRAGDVCNIQSNAVETRIAGSHRQIATGDGTLVNPVGFPL
jgi:hypothetical protein